jgi:ribosomal protein S18 acetylase RimI-like enzyme
MQILYLNDKPKIETYLRKDIPLHIYGLGDLDDFFWPYTFWFGSKRNRRLQSVVLLYTATNPPILLGLASPGEIESIRKLLHSLLPLLPETLYVHLSPGLDDILRREYVLNTHGEHYKMILKNMRQVENFASKKVKRISRKNLTAVTDLYNKSYPGNAFDPRMLDTGHYFAYLDGEKLVSVAGIHVYSRKYGVAAVGNITTHPAFRGLGLGKATTATLCQSLLNFVVDIGLNVKTDNIQAIQCYTKLGFEKTHSYYEFSAVRK